MEFGALLTVDGLTALATLTAMEIVLGIDNIVFISILVSKLPLERQARIRTTGIFLAVVMRLGLLFSISWIMGLTAPLFTVLGRELSGRSLILIVGGLFLIGKATFEIHDKLEGREEPAQPDRLSRPRGASAIVFQILLLDLVFSLDSVITAVGMAQNLAIMVTAMLVATGVMVLSARTIGHFIEKHPTLKILALSFLVLIGVTLLVEGTGGHIGKGYIYSAMAFSMLVEMLNLRYRARTEPVHLRSHPPKA